MNREDIIRMAQEAGFNVEQGFLLRVTGVDEDLERFAALVAAAAEREKVATWMTRQGYATGHGDTVEDLLVELEWQVRESEREACAKVPVTLVEEGMAEHMPEGDELILARKNLALAVVIAEVIRARGEQ